MRTEKYKQIFIKEAKEYLKEIYSHLQALEESFDSTRVGEMERYFHSIKGMASTMGYKEIAELAHKIEDMLKDVSKKGELEVDDYENIVQSADKIMAFVSELETGKEIKEKTEEVTEGKRKLFRIKIQADSKNTLPGPRYFVIYKRLKDKGKIHKMNLSPEDFKKGYKGIFECIYETEEYDKDTLFSFLKEEPDLEWVSVEEWKEKEEKEKGRAISFTSESVVDELLAELVRVGEGIMRMEYLSSLKGLEDISYEASSLAVQFRNVFSRFVGLRMVPLSEAFAHVPAVVRSTASSTKKKVDFEFIGGELVVDKYVASLLVDPVLHILRNAVDHGIETPDERVKCGKPERGKIRFICEEKAGTILITIEDDGKGIDVEKVKKIALDKGLVTEEKIEGLSKEEVYSFLTLPGFSTREEVTEVSGRGVGMDVVKNVVERLGGDMKIESELGRFTRITLSFPVSVSLTDIFVFEVEGYTFGVFPSFIERISGREDYSDKYGGVIVESRFYPVYRFSPFEGMKKVGGEEIEYLILCRKGEECFAMAVDSVEGVTHMFLNLARFPLNLFPGVVGTCVDEKGKLCVVINPFELRRLL